jgi:hypothetical protein
MTEPESTDTDALERAESEAAAEAAATVPAAPERPIATDEIDDIPSSADYSTAFSPRNVAVGLAIVAGLVAFAARRHRRKPDRGREDS